MTKTFHASIWFRKEKPYGVGKTAYQRHQHIVEGWRASVVTGLRGNEEIYTGACATREDAIAELISHLKQAGYSGVLKFL